MESSPLQDCAGRPRSPATLASFHQNRPPRNKGLRYPPDPPTVEEIIAVMRAAGDSPEGLRLRSVIVVLWRAGLRISEALALAESDLDERAARWWSARARAGGVARSGWTGGRGSSSTRGWGFDLRCRSAHCSASSVVRPAGVRARRLGFASSYATPPARLASAAGSRPISCGMRTPWRCRVRASRCWSSSGSSGMPISGSRPLTCEESTTPRSSTPSTNDRHL